MWPEPGPVPPGTHPAELVLEVLGGPEDGRVVRLPPGERLGRRPLPGEPAPDAERPDVPLFVSAPVVRGGSVRLLEHLAGGRVRIPIREGERDRTLLQLAARSGERRGLRRGEEVELHAGDVLKLHRTVFLLVVASPAPVNS